MQLADLKFLKCFFFNNNNMRFENNELQLSQTFKVDQIRIQNIKEC